ncbi:glycosyltransferase family 2 protein [Alteromonas sp. K632G]|uniref:glycosyltransferase family 2 protein n=1 Tax=Alteromonas sp. K632G TaxID=2820757 RepID=UPI001AD6CA36|nr:glycosyltransferase family 2 protein [Alteromonas sp. K632G]MBO7924095.1 glycosyltransferase family 2 protein [Alteromonas sp. K632G]
MEPIVTKIIAVAKDEGAYLAEWIFYHLYKGFDEIEVLINRTTDPSRTIIDRINKTYPQVSFTNVDFVDWVPGAVHQKFQQIAYASALETTINSSENQTTHVMFLDIDEYWVHEDFSVSISSYLNQVGSEKAISFCWLNEHPSDKPFTYLDKTLKGNRSQLVKSIFPLSRGMKKVQLHQPILKTGRFVNADGSRWEASDSSSEQSIHSIYKPAFICHRLYRSPMEYTSTLMKGNIRGGEIPFKTNRHGLPNGTLIPQVSLEMDHMNWVEYENERDDFIRKLDLQSLIDDSREFVKERYDASVDTLRKLLPVHHKQLIKLFSNAECEEVEATFSAYHDELIRSFEEQVEKVRDLALLVEQYSTVEALRIMEIALSLRPDGPKIKAKVMAYREKLDI